MTLEDAREHVGDKVTYDAGCDRCQPEEGVITSVSRRFAFVRYGADYGSKATDPAMLTLLAGGAS